MRNFKVALAAACAVVVGWAFTASADIPASAYVQDGLIAQWDGIDNAGTGTHDPSATTWKDLKGQGGDMSLEGLTSPVWDGKGLSFSAGGIYNSTDTTKFLCTPNVLKLGDEFTIQMFCNTGDKYDCRRWDVVPYTSSYESWTSQSEGFLERINGANRFSLKPWVSNADIIFTTVAGDKKHRFMIEPIGGTVQSVEGNLASCTVNNRLAFMKTNGSNVPRKDCYSIRIYNRALTPDEVAWNAVIDKLRFEGAEGYRYDGEQNRIEYSVRVENDESRGVVTVGGNDIGGLYEGWFEFKTEHSITVQATPKPGYRFLRWNGELAETQVFNPSLTLSGSDPIKVVAVYGVDNEFSARDYSRDGLVFQLDGIENAGIGMHNAAATEWIDLASGIKIPLAADDTVGEKFTQLVTSKTFSGFKDVKTTEAFTVEVCQRSTAYLGTEINQHLTFQVCGRCYFGYRANASEPGVSTLLGGAIESSFKAPHPIYGVDNGILRNLTQTNAHTFAVVSRVGSFDAWFDGESRPHGEKSVSSGWAAAGDGTGTIGNSTAKPEYYAVRVYNRALTDAELERHARIDRIRFFGADEGMRPGAAGDEYRVRVTTPDGSVTDTWYAKGETANLSYSPRVGETFRFWKPVPEGVDRTQTSISFTVNEPLSTVARVVDNPFRLTAASYVREGLVLQFDGIANAGIDADGDELHNGQSAWWKDLSGEGQDAYVVKNDTKIQWTDDACDQMAFGYMVGGYFAFPIGDAFFDAQNNRNASTIQMVGRKRPEGTGNCYTHLVGYSGGWSFYMLNLTSSMSYFACGQRYDFTNAKASTNMTLTTTFTTAGAPAGNGFLRRWFGSDDYAQSTVSTSSMKDLTGRTGNIFGVGYYDQGFILRAARFYNRELTDYERLLNTRIDEERFYGTNATRIVSVESESSNFGAPAGYGYGAYRVEPGEAISCSFTDSLELFNDGIRALPVADGERTGLVGYTVTNRVTGSYSNETASEFVGTADDDFRLIWHWRHQYQLKYVAATGGSVYCEKGSGGWFDEGASIMLGATPSAEYKFAGWAGDTMGIPDLTVPTIYVPIDRARSLTAVFQERHHEPVSLTWQANTPGRWSDPANWGGTVPQEGDFVTIGAAAEVTLDTATPSLGSLTLEGTLSSGGWNNLISAETVTVSPGGLLTCVGDFGSSGNPSNRVWVCCTNLVVAGGGAIDVTGKGWKSAPGVYGAGPGAGTVPCCGGSYGGFAGSGYIGFENSGQMMMPYGEAEDPRDPGSAGSAAVLGDAVYCGGAGGGAVLIEATGSVTLNGGIVADGTNGSGNKQGAASGGGSGGGVSIWCRTISGSGMLSARGGNKAAGAGGNGSGGRIALHYDLTEQAKLPRPGFTFDAGTPIATTTYGYESSPDNGEGGTVWLPDAALIAPEEFNITGQVLVDGAELSLPTLVIDSRRVAFTQDGFKLTVAGDVTLQGTGAATLELGGSLLVHRAYGCWDSTGHTGFRRFGDQSPIDIRIGGKLTVGGARGEVVLRGAKMTAADADPADCRPVGGTLKVGGTLSVAKNGRIVPVSHYCTGVSPRIECGHFELAEGATVTASSQGYYSKNPLATLPLEGEGSYGFGPGSAGPGYTTGYCAPGASHLGLGGAGEEGNLGKSLPDTYLYDTAEMPHMPGSGCANTYGNTQAAGGGVFFLEVRGRTRLSGTIAANGSTQGSGHASGCAGGAIYIRTSRLYIAPTAVIQAKGASSSGNAGCGGGGGVALWRVHDHVGSVLTTGMTPEEAVAAGFVSAAAGKEPDAKHLQTHGTVVLGLIPPKPLCLIVR